MSYASVLYINNNISFIIDPWSISQAQSHTPEHKKMFSHKALLQNRCLHMTNTDWSKNILTAPQL